LHLTIRKEFAMDYTVSVSNAAKSIALTRALNAYNAGNPTLNEQQFIQKLVDGQLDGLVASYVNVRIDVIDFLNRFTAQERVAIREAAKVNAQLDDYLQLLNAAPGGKVNLTSDTVSAGVQSLEAAGLIGTGRAAEILTLG
jgi:hypothetical protein